MSHRTRPLALLVYTLFISSELALQAAAEAVPLDLQKREDRAKLATLYNQPIKYDGRVYKFDNCSGSVTANSSAYWWTCSDITGRVTLLNGRACAVTKGKITIECQKYPSGCSDGRDTPDEQRFFANPVDTIVSVEAPTIDIGSMIYEHDKKNFTLESKVKDYTRDGQSGTKDSYPLSVQFGGCPLEQHCPKTLELLLPKQPAKPVVKLPTTSSQQQANTAAAQPLMAVAQQAAPKSAVSTTWVKAGIAVVAGIALAMKLRSATKVTQTLKQDE